MPARKNSPSTKRAAKPKTQTRIRRTHEELFVDALRKLARPDQAFVSNATVRERLGWDEARYDRVKEQLLTKRAIAVGTGRGGTIRILTGQALKVFISYSHADEEYRHQLVKHLSPLKRINLVSEWHDGELQGGEEWNATILKNLQTSDIVLLLISIDFINSEYCYGIELEKALELHERKRCVVVPVILRSCLWQHTQFSKLQALPDKGKPVSSFPDADAAFTSIVEGLKEIADKLLTTRNAGV